MSKTYRRLHWPPLSRGQGVHAGACLLACGLACAAAGAAWGQPAAQSSIAALSNAQVPGPPFSAREVSEELEIGNIEHDTLRTAPITRRVYKLKLPKGFGPNGTFAIQIDLTSTKIDGVLELYEEGARVPFMQDDDSGGGRNARIILPPRDWRKPIIIVVTDAGEATGEYELLAARTDFVRPPELQQLRLGGQPVSASLGSASPRREGLGYPYAKYVLRATPGQRVQIDVKATAFDPVIELRHNDALIGRDDDSGDGHNARFIRRLTKEGDYTLWVLSPGGGLGDFTVSAQPVGEAAAQAVEQPIASPAQVSGAIGLESPLLGDRPFALYRLSGRAGELVTAKLEGIEPSTMGARPRMALEVGADTAAGFAVLRRTPLSTAGPAVVRIHFVRNGDVLLRVTSGLDWIGNYTLTVGPAPPAGPESGKDLE